MNWTELLRAEAGEAYRVTEGLLDQVGDADLGWKPATGDNWMTTGQLLQHLTEACGMCFKGFVTGDWGMPEGAAPGDGDEPMMPTAEQMGTVASVAEAREKLASDKAVAFAVLEQVGEDRLRDEDSAAPWDPDTMKLGRRLLQMVHHLDQHKGQLYYYLKLQGKPVDTSHLWGM